ncbi:MAG: pyrroline-5-carboxylate reductase [Pseudomonadota bacterium]
MVESSDSFGSARVLLVGCGNMGGAMLRGWIAGGLSGERLMVLDPAPRDDVKQAVAAAGGQVVADAAALSDRAPPDLVVLAVKPQIMDQVLPTVAPRIGDATVALSVAAGRTIASFEAALPAGTAVVRSIPNTPAAIGRGITVCCANAAVTAEGRARVTAALSAIGAVGWVDDEGLIDAATAVSGSGPAYVFYLAECLEAAARDVGLPADLARQLAVATVSGAGELLAQADAPAATLRENVTSPNGTTAAALDVLMGNDGLRPLLAAAVTKARDRSRELSD